MSKKVILIFLIMINFNVMAKVYFCPKEPLKVVVGDYVDSDWFIWEKKKIVTDEMIKYYEKNPRIITVDKWDSMSHGKNIRNNNYYISCCFQFGKINQQICAYKDIEEKYCELQMTAAPKMQFQCSNIEKKDPMFEWMERDRLASK